MGRIKTHKRINKKLNGKQITKRFVKLLSLIKNPSLTQNLIRHSPESVIKAICNATLTAQKGNIQFGGSKRKILSRYRKQIYKLVDPKISIKSKRKILQQRGGFAWLPIILSTVLSAVGGALFNRAKE